MRILSVVACYNERDFLPLQVELLALHGVDCFVLDNGSTDGTWEWVRGRDLPAARIDTDGSFHLERLQEARLGILARERPDWVVYGDADELIFTAVPLAAQVARADGEGYDALEIPHLNLHATGERGASFDPVGTYFYYDLPARPWRTRVHRYHASLRYRADAVEYAFTPRLLRLEDAVVCNYGATKSPERRQETLRRRRKAWAMGLDRELGSHYLEQERRGWTRRREELHDLRRSPWMPRIRSWHERLRQRTGARPV